MAVTVRTLENFIGGEWVASTGESARAVVSPVTGETLAEAPNASAEDVDRAVAAARAAQPKWAALSAWERAKICHAIADLIDERREDFARELSLEQGKPYAAEALGDIDETAENFRIAAEDVKRMETAIIPSQDPNKRILTFRKPNGVYAGITPWNFPTLIPVELIAPGNRRRQHDRDEAVRVDADRDGELHADHGGRGSAGRRRERGLRRRRRRRTPRHASRRRLHRFRRLASDRREDRPRRRSQAIPDRGERQRARRRLRGRRPRARRAGRRLRRLLLRGAGVLRDGARPRARKRARLVPRRGPEGRGLMAARRSVRRLDHGRPDEQRADGRRRWIGIWKTPWTRAPTSSSADRARATARPISTTSRPSSRTSASTRSSTSRRRSARSCRSSASSPDEEALAVANDSHLGLQAAVYTSSLKRAFRFVDNLRVGNVVVNDSTDYWEAHEPFGGASGTQSGWGRIGGRYTMLDMSDLKTVVLDVGGLE